MASGYRHTARNAEGGDPRHTTMNDDTNDDATETNHNLNESADKIRLSTKLKRGTGTRDQDTHTLKARGETPEEAAENLSDALAELEAHNVFDRMRAVGNDADE